MNALLKNAELADRFAIVAKQFCTIVEAPGLSRAEFLAEIYSLLPKLMDQAIGMPDVEPDGANEGVQNEAETSESARMKHTEWQSLFAALQNRLGDWESYHLVFDPIRDCESIHGSLADDLADIYRDLNEVLVERGSDSISPADQIWKWRFSFCTHWGKHAIDALSAIHSHLHY